jgi:ABC-2 type transport system ATP-binding protein
MADQSKTNLNKLSSGMLRRLAFGRAMLHKPQVLLFYEPFARCDETAIAMLSSLMRQLAGSGAAVLILADDATHLTSLSDVIFNLQQGQLIETHRRDEARQDFYGFKIPVRIDEKVVLLDPVSILYAEAESGRARLQTVDRSLPTQFTMSELEERLSRSGFFRAHRSYLVNLQHVKEVIPYTRNSFTLRLDDESGTEIPLSKSAASELRDLLGY